MASSANGISILNALAAEMSKKNFSQSVISARSGLTTKTIQNVVADRHDPKLDTVCELARALGLKLVLVPREQGKTNASDDDQAAGQAR